MIQNPERLRLLYRAGDLAARMMLNDAGVALTEAGWESEIHREITHTVWHAEIYLSDRLAYEVDRKGAIIAAFDQIPFAQWDSLP